MPRLKNTPPTYRLHKLSGRAIVTFDGRDHHLGKFGSREGQARFQQLLAGWQATRDRPTASRQAAPLMRAFPDSKWRRVRAQ